MVEKISQFIRENGTITLAQCRDLFQTSRKYAQAILEYMDQTWITVRERDFRKLR
jgi:selenocysteine-specific elongation factor